MTNKPCACDEYQMGNSIRPFDTLDDLIGRLSFIASKFAAAPTADHEIVCALLILAREIKGLKR